MAAIDHHRPWSALQRELLELVLDRLCFGDHVRFGAVCRSWGSLAAGSPHSRALRSPWFVFLRSPPTGTFEFFSPVEGRARRIRLPSSPDCRFSGSSMGWLVLTHRVHGHRLLNPFTNRSVRLPPSPSHYPDGIDLGPTLHMFDHAVLSSAPTPTPENCIVVAMYNILLPVFCRPGDKEWTFFESYRSDWKHFIFFGGLLHCVTNTDQMMAYEFTPQPVCRHKFTLAGLVEKRDGSDAKRCHLVESAGVLLLVVQYLVDCPPAEDNILGALFCLKPKTIHFSVYRMETSCGQRLVKVRSLGDDVMFVGSGFARAVGAEHFPVPKFKKNHIYFTDCVDDEYVWYEFCMEDEKIQPVALDICLSSQFPRRWRMIDVV